MISFSSRLVLLRHFFVFFHQSSRIPFYRLISVANRDDLFSPSVYSPSCNPPPSVPSGLLVARHQFARIHLLLLLLYMHIHRTTTCSTAQRVYNKANTARLLMILGLLVVVHPRCISLLFVSFTIFGQKISTLFHQASF